jgi:hypothetical protein
MILFAILVTANTPGCSASVSPLPEVADVKSIELIENHGKSTASFSPEHFAAVLAVFKSGARDSRPAKWIMEGYHLEITTNDGGRSKIWLFKTLHGKGAFAIGPTWEQRTYFRGSTDQEIDNVIQQAIAGK